MARRRKGKRTAPLADQGGLTPTQSWADVAGVALIAVAILVAYLPALHGGFILDDKLLLTDNPVVKDDNGLYRIWFTADAIDYWPVFNSTFWLQWRLWGMNATGYHVVNVLLHGVSVLLVWVILRRLSIPGAWLAALLFAVHPVNVESVAWISQCKNLLALVFFLVSVLAFVTVEREPPDRRRAAAIWYGLSLGAFVLAMLSKGSVAMLPALLLVILWWRRPVTRWDLVRLLPFFAISVVLIGVNMWFQRHSSDTQVRAIGFAERLLGAGGVVWFYLGKTVLPFNLAFIYPRWDVHGDNPLWWLPISAVLGLSVLLWWYRRGWSRPVLLAWAYFCIALVPVLGLVDVAFMEHSLVADHYQHVAIIGILTLLAAAWGAWQQGWQRRPIWAPLGVAAVVIVGLTALTWRQSSLYADSRTLFTAAVAMNPGSSLAHNDLGVALLDAGRVREADEHFVQALALKPNYADALRNRGLALIQSDRPSEAIDHFQRALQLRPDDAASHNDLAIALARTGQLDDSIRHFVEALRLKPDFADAEHNLEIALALRQKQLAARQPDIGGAPHGP